MNKKVPAIEREFLIDQRTCRKMGSDDRPVTAILSKRSSLSLREESFTLEPSTSGQVPSQNMIKSLCSLESGNITVSESSSGFKYVPRKSTIR